MLWPTKNVFHHPDHWYECMLQCGVVWMGEFYRLVGLFFCISNLNLNSISDSAAAICSAFLLGNTAAWLGTRRLLSLRCYLVCYLTGAASTTAFWCLLYILEFLLPDNYYRKQMLGAQVDQVSQVLHCKSTASDAIFS